MKKIVARQIINQLLNSQKHSLINILYANLHLRVGFLRMLAWNMYQNPYQNNYPLWITMQAYVLFYIALIFHNEYILFL